MKRIKLAFIAAALALFCVLPTMAQDPKTEGENAAAPEAKVEAPKDGTTPTVEKEAVNWAKGLGVGLGAGLIILGASYGISLIGSRAVESMARQPEVAGNINGAMIVSAALIEGATFFSLIVVMLVLFVG